MIVHLKEPSLCVFFKIAKGFCENEMMHEESLGFGAIVHQQDAPLQMKTRIQFILMQKSAPKFEVVGCHVLSFQL